MTTELSAGWHKLAQELDWLATSAGEQGHPDLPTPSPVLVTRAILFIGWLQQGGIPPAHRLSATVPRVIHLEWFKLDVHVVLAIKEAEVAEFVSYSGQGKFVTQSVAW